MTIRKSKKEHIIQWPEKGQYRDKRTNNDPQGSIRINTPSSIDISSHCAEMNQR